MALPPPGNFEGQNILHVRHDSQPDDTILKAKRTLYDVRAKRVWPGRDEKIIASWNGLALRGVATAARIFDSKDFTKLALDNAEFLRNNMIKDGRVMRSYKDGVAKVTGFLEDYAAVALGFIALHELTGSNEWLNISKHISNSMMEWFWDDEKQMFFDTAKDSEKLITRPRDVTDNATPSGTSLAAELLLQLSDIENSPELRERGVQIMRSAADPMSRYPTAFGHLLSAAYACRDGVCDIPLPQQH